MLSFKLQLYCEACVCNTVLASHIDTTALAEGTYELFPESKDGDPEAQVNATVLTEAPDQSPEEPKANLASTAKASPGHKPAFQIITIYHYYLLMHLQFLGFELKP